MKATSIRAVEMVRRIRDRQAKLLAGKTPSEVIAFYRAAGEAAMQDARQRSTTRLRSNKSRILAARSRGKIRG